ncbi:hypothetical protein HDU80_008332 [Chytriomyces hyalinus]|nr:hypothetical protein HDU80_008332 [Chytriomyces hyalinus]
MQRTLGQIPSTSQRWSTDNVPGPSAGLDGADLAGLGSSIKASRRSSLPPTSNTTPSTEAAVLSYQNVFWKPFKSRDQASIPLADVQAEALGSLVGVKQLCALFEMHFSEMESLLAMVKLRIQMEESVAKSIEDMEANLDSFQSHYSSIRNPTLQWLTIMKSTALTHRKHADTLILAVVNPLSTYLTKYRQVVDFRRSQVDSTHDFLQKTLKEMHTRYVTYQRSCEQRNPDISSVKKEFISSVAAAEQARSALESHIADFCQFAQEAQHMRLQVCKEAFLALESAQIFTIQHQAKLWTNLDPSSSSETTTILECPDPGAGTFAIARDYQTGTARTPTLCYPILEMPVSQAFGFSLEELERRTGDSVPPLVRTCVSALYEGVMKKRMRGGVDAWLDASSSDLPSIQFLRTEANTSCGGVALHFSRVQRESPVVVAGVLKLFLLELPASLITNELYDTLKMVYTASGPDSALVPEDEEIRLKTVSNLLTTLPVPHYETLTLVAGLLHKVISSIPPFPSKLNQLIHTITPCLLRPSTETRDTFQDTHPHKFTSDLLTHFTTLFKDNLPPDTAFSRPNTPPPAAAAIPHGDLIFGEYDSDNEVEDDFYHSQTPDGRRRSVRLSGRRPSSILNVVKDSASQYRMDVVAGVMRGLARSVSEIGLKASEGAAAAAVAVATGAGLVGAGGSGLDPMSVGSGTGGWFVDGNSIRGASALDGIGDGFATRRGVTSRKKSMVSMVGLEELDEFSEDEGDFAEEDLIESMCQWDGCGLKFGGRQQLMMHVAVAHMEQGSVNGVVIIQEGLVGMDTSFGDTRFGSKQQAPKGVALKRRVSSPLDRFSEYSDSDSDSDSDNSEFEDNFEKLRSDSPLLRMTPKVTPDSSPDRNHSNANISSMQRINSMLILAGFEPIEFAASGGATHRSQMRYSSSRDSLDSEEALDHVHSSILPLVHRLVTALNALNSAHASVVDANAILRSDNSTLSDRVARLKKGLVDKEFDLTKLRELRREADDNCRAAVAKCRATEKELKTVKNDFLALVGKVGGCCNDGIKDFVNSPTTPSKKGKSEHHGLPCSKCFAKLRQTRSSTAIWIDGVGFIDDEGSEERVMTPTVSRRRTETPTSPTPKRPTTIASLYSSLVGSHSKQRASFMPKNQSNSVPKPAVVPASTPEPTPTSHRFSRSISSMSSGSEPTGFTPPATPPATPPLEPPKLSNPRITTSLEHSSLPTSIRRSSSINHGRTSSSSSLDSTGTPDSPKQRVPGLSSSSKASISTMTEVPPPLDSNVVKHDKKTPMLETLVTKKQNLLEPLALQHQTPPNSFFMLPPTPTTSFPSGAFFDSDESPTTTSHKLHDLADRFTSLEQERKQLTSAATELGFERMQLKEERDEFFEEVRAFRTENVLVGLDQVLELENETPIVDDDDDDLYCEGVDEFDLAVSRDQEVLRRASETSLLAVDPVEIPEVIHVEESLVEDAVKEVVEVSVVLPMDAAVDIPLVLVDDGADLNTDAVPATLIASSQAVEEPVLNLDHALTLSPSDLTLAETEPASHIEPSHSHPPILSKPGIVSDPEILFEPDILIEPTNFSDLSKSGTYSEPTIREIELDDPDSTLVLTSPTFSLQELSTSPPSPTKPKHLSAPDITAKTKTKTDPPQDPILTTTAAERPTSTRNLIAQFETIKNFRPILELKPPSIIATHAVTRAFIPSTSRSDEVPLARGDLVHVEQVFEDGWVRVMSFRQGAGGGRVGFVPGVCLREVTGGASRVVVVESGGNGGDGKRGGVEKSWVGAVGRKAVRFQSDVVEIGKTGWGERGDSLEVGDG